MLRGSFSSIFDHSGVDFGSTYFQMDEITRLCVFSSFSTLFSFIDRIFMIASFVDKYWSYCKLGPVLVDSNRC